MRKRLLEQRCTETEKFSLGLATFDDGLDIDWLQSYFSVHEKRYPRFSYRVQWQYECFDERVLVAQHWTTDECYLYSIEDRSSRTSMIKLTFPRWDCQEEHINAVLVPDDFFRVVGIFSGTVEFVSHKLLFKDHYMRGDDQYSSTTQNRHSGEWIDYQRLKRSSLLFVLFDQ